MLQFDEYKVKLNNLLPALEELGDALGLDAAAREAEMLESESASDGFWNDLEKAQKVQRRIAQLKSKLEGQARRKSEWSDLMTLCEADITSKNEVRKKHFLENFRIVRSKLHDLKEKDYKRLLQPCIDGTEIMEMFNLKPSREVGELKKTLKDAVLDNRVPNEREPLMALLVEKARQMGLA